MENCYIGIRAMGDEDIFIPEYHKKYIEMEVGAYEVL